MAEAINPFREWLGIDTAADKLNHYELLDLPTFEADIDKIHRAADRALAQVRSHRPGPHAAAWAQLLDTIAQAKKCLSDPVKKAAYDRALHHQAQSSSSTSAQPVTAAAEIAAVNQNPDLFPPGMQPASPPAGTSPRDERGTQHSQPSRPATDIRKEKQEKPVAKTSTAPGPTRHAKTPDHAQPEESAAAPTAGLTPQPAVPKPPPPPAPTTTDVDRAVPLLSDPFEQQLAGGSKLADIAPTPPVNAHVAPPREQSSSTLPMLLVVVVVVIIVTLTVGMLAMNGSFLDGASESPSPPVSPPPTTQGAGGAATSPPATSSAAGTPQTSVRPSVTSPATGTSPAGTAQAPLTPSAGAGAPSTSLPGTATPATGIFGAPVPPAKPDTTTVQDGPPASDQTTAGSTTDAATDATPPAATAQTPPANQTGPITPAAPPSPAQLKQLSRALQDAQAALARHEFPQASRALATAEQLAVLPQHKDMVAGLQQLAQHSTRFWETVAAVIQSFQGAEELTVGSGGLIVIVVETGPNWIVVKKEGRNLRYSLTDMPPGLALAIAKTQLDTSDPNACLLLGACLATTAERKQTYLDEARKYWNQAAAAGADTGLLLPTLSNTYELAQ